MLFRSLDPSVSRPAAELGLVDLWVHAQSPDHHELERDVGLTGQGGAHRHGSITARRQVQGHGHLAEGGVDVGRNGAGRNHTFRIPPGGP